MDTFRYVPVVENARAYQRPSRHTAAQARLTLGCVALAAIAGVALITTLLHADGRAPTAPYTTTTAGSGSGVVGGRWTRHAVDAEEGDVWEWSEFGEHAPLPAQPQPQPPQRDAQATDGQSEEARGVEEGGVVAPRVVYEAGEGSGDAKYDRLMAWLLKGGATTDGVEGRPMFAGGGRGLFATRDLPKGHKAFSVPFHLWMSESIATTSSAVSYVLLQDPVARKFVEIPEEGWALVLLLEYERTHPNSFWAPYLDFMPRPASPVASWTPEQVQAAQSDTLTALVNTNVQHITDVYNELMPHLFQTYPHMFVQDQHSLHEFVGSTITAWTRAYNVGHSTHELGLVPLGDLINHKTGVPFNHWHKEYPNCKPLDKTLPCDSSLPHSFVFKLPEQSSPNSEVVISYSDTRATMSWLVWGGFVPPNTFGDYITLSLDHPSSGSVQASELSTWVGADGRIPEAFVKLCTKVVSGTDQRKPELWRGAIERLKEGVEAVVAGLPTTLQQDKDELAQGGHDFPHQVALEARVKFKTILDNVLCNLAHRAKTAPEKLGEWAVPRQKSLLDSWGRWSASDKHEFALFTALVRL